MKLIIIILTITLLKTEVIQAQNVIMPKDVESRIAKNRKENKPSYEGVLIVVSFPNSEISNIDFAKVFDTRMMVDITEKIKSCTSSNGGNGFNTVVIANGETQIEEIKTMTINCHGSLISWQLTFILEENIITNLSNEALEIPQIEFNEMPINKRNYVTNHPNRYSIIR